MNYETLELKLKEIDSDLGVIVSEATGWVSVTSSKGNVGLVDKPKDEMDLYAALYDHDSKKEIAELLIEFIGTDTHNDGIANSFKEVSRLKARLKELQTE